MKRIWDRISKREKNLLGLTSVVFLLVLSRYFLISPFLERREWVKSQLGIQPQALESSLRYIGQKDIMGARLDEARELFRAAQASLLSGSTPSLSASELQQAVHALASESGAQVISTRVLNPEAMSWVIKIPIQVEVTGEIDQIANLIAGIEFAEKLLIVDELNIRSVFSRVRVARRQGEPQVTPSQLRASVTVSGFARREPAAGKAKEGEAAPREKRSVK